MKKINVVAAIIINKNKILITQRNDEKFKSLWEFPGGKIEENETPENALIREIKEELNLNIKIENELIQTSYTYDFAIVNIKTFICKIIDGNIQKNVHSNIEWTNSWNLKNYKWVPADIEIVNYFLKYSNKKLKWTWK